MNIKSIQEALLVLLEAADQGAQGQVLVQGILAGLGVGERTALSRLSQTSLAVDVADSYLNALISLVEKFRYFDGDFYESHGELGRAMLLLMETVPHRVDPRIHLLSDPAFMAQTLSTRLNPIRLQRASFSTVANESDSVIRDIFGEGAVYRHLNWSDSAGILVTDGQGRNFVLDMPSVHLLDHRSSLTITVGSADDDEEIHYETLFTFNEVDQIIRMLVHGFNGLIRQGKCQQLLKISLASQSPLDRRHPSDIYHSTRVIFRNSSLIFKLFSSLNVRKEQSRLIFKSANLSNSTLLKEVISDRLPPVVSVPTEIPVFIANPNGGSDIKNATDCEVACQLPEMPIVADSPSFNVSEVLPWAGGVSFMGAMPSAGFLPVVL